MENVRDCLRSNKLCAVLCNSYDTVVQACNKGLGLSYQRPGSRPLHRRARVGVCQSLGGLD